MSNAQDIELKPCPCCGAEAQGDGGPEMKRACKALLAFALGVVFALAVPFAFAWEAWREEDA